MYCAYYYNKFLCLCEKPTNFAFTIVLLLFSHSVMSDSLRPCPWDFSGKKTGVGCHFLLQGIFLTQGLNLSLLCLLHYRQILYHCATQEAKSKSESRSVVSDSL